LRVRVTRKIIQLLTTLLIATLNKILENNQGSRNLLQQHAGKSFMLNIIGFNLRAKIECDGLFSAPLNDNYTVTINIPLNAATYLVNQDKLAVFKSISFKGDKHFGRKILEILSNLHSTGIYVTKSPAMTFVINQLNTIFSWLREHIKLVVTNASTSITEYLLYETEDIAERYEIAKFCNEVDELRNRVDVLTQRLNLLAVKSS